MRSLEPDLCPHWAFTLPLCQGRRVGVRLCSWQMHALHSLTPLNTQPSHSHAHFYDVSVWRNVWKGTFWCFQIVPVLVMEQFSEPVKAVEWCTSSPMFCVYDSAVKQLFWRFQSKQQVKRPERMWNANIHRRTSSESLRWRSNKVSQQVAAFPVVSLPQIPCHQTPWPCHPGGDSPRTHTHTHCITHTHSFTMCHRANYQESGWFKFPFLSHR